MKHRLKGLLALVLSLVMVFALATNAWAAVSIGNVELNQENNYSVNGISGQGTATYDSTTKTLTLNNFVYEGTYGITATDNLTIDLIGDNKITYSSDSGNASISIEGNLTITSSDPSAKLTADFDTTSSSTKGGGIKATNLTIESGTVSAIAVGTNSHGIEATNAVSITGGTVTAGSATDDGSGNVNYNSAFGIKAGSSISITGGTVTATGLDAIAIYEHTTTGTISISGATTTVTANGKNSGIYAKGSVSIAGGTVLANSTNDDGWGIYGGGDVTIKDGAKVEANASDISGIGIGTIYSTNSTSSANTIVISGEGTEVKAGCHTGLSAYEVTILENSKLTIDAATISAIVCGALNFSNSTYSNNNWYQWKADNNPVEKSSDTNQLEKNEAAGAKILTIGKITYTATFNANGHGTAPSAQSSIAAGGKVTEPTPPTENGWRFDGWYKEQNCTTKWDFNTDTVTADITLYAKWTENSTGGPGAQQPSYNYPIAPTTPEPEGEKVTTPDTFDGGIASAVVVTILSATGGAWLAKKKD